MGRNNIMRDAFLLGTLLNASGILLGGLFGLARQQPLSLALQNALKGILGVLILFVGLRAAWLNFGGGFWLVLKQLTIVVLGLTLGRLTGRLLHLQKGANHLGRYANSVFTKAAPGQPPRWNDGFLVGTILFCATPMAVLGAVQDGLGGHWQTLAVKAAIDGLAAMSFVQLFGWGSILSLIPVLAWQGTLALVAQLFALALLGDPALAASLHATAGLLVFCLGLLVLELRKIEVADYLPSLAWAPLLAWLWR